jgi:hypothetical protein
VTHSGHEPTLEVDFQVNQIALAGAATIRERRTSEGEDCGERHLKVGFFGRNRLLVDPHHLMDISHSPIILTSTLFLRPPSNSP